MSKIYILNYGLLFSGSALVFLSACYYGVYDYTSWQFWVGFFGIITGAAIIYIAGYLACFKEGRPKQE